MIHCSGLPPTLIKRNPLSGDLARHLDFKVVCKDVSIPFTSKKWPADRSLAKLGLKRPASCSTRASLMLKVDTESFFFPAMLTSKIAKLMLMRSYICYKGMIDTMVAWHSNMSAFSWPSLDSAQTVTDVPLCWKPACDPVADLQKMASVPNQISIPNDSESLKICPRKQCTWGGMYKHAQSNLGEYPELRIERLSCVNQRERDTKSKRARGGWRDLRI